MSLYDGLGMDSKEKGQREQKPDIAAWSSGIKLLQSQLQLKKAALTQVKKEQVRKGATLTPVLDLKSRKEDLDEMPPPPAINLVPQGREAKMNSTASLLGGEWDIRQEYDPFWPNDYEKIMRDRRERKEKDRDRDRDRDRDDDRRNRDDNRENYRNNRRRDGGGRDRYERPKELEMRGPNREEEEEAEMIERTPRRGPSSGAAIAPPPSLTEPSEKAEKPPQSTSFTGLIPSLGSSVAARIMAKYGFREGQGLGKQEQGMSVALQVEKTSKRGGKIIHEKDITKGESPPLSMAPPSPPSPGTSNQGPPESITEIMRNPSKVVLLRNMVGPGEVDEDLEPETKEECGKYGDVIKCLIFEISDGNTCEEEAVRIFVEFKRVESAIKAVVDLNGRYFGGRIVKATFYDNDKFRRLELLE